MQFLLAAPAPGPDKGGAGGSSVATWLMVALIGFFVYSMFTSGPRLKKGAAAPPLPLAGITKTTKSAPTFAGKVTVLYFWASWCGVCKRDLPSSSRFAQKMEKKGIRYLLINTDRGVNAPSLSAFLQKKRVGPSLWKYHFFDPKSVSIRRYRIQAFPTTVILNREGKVAAVYRGRLPKSALATALKRI